MEPLVKIEDVSFHYPNQKIKVLKKINLVFNQGDFVAVIGPNGSGKSTLAKMLNALLLPTDGTVVIDKIETSNSEDMVWYIRSKVGMVFQNPENQLIANTIEEDVAFGLENLGVSPSEIRARVDEALTKVDLISLSLSEPHYLSGGEKQKVAIAGIIAMRPKVIIFDEATSMLDPKSKLEILKTIKQLNRQEEITIILITHSFQEALLADRVVVMNEGKIALNGPPGDIYKEYKLLKEIGLVVPLTMELALRLNNKGYQISEELLTEEEFVAEIWKLF